MTYSLRIGIVLVILLLNATAWAEVTSCPEHFASGQAPDIINQKLANKTQNVCYSPVALQLSFPAFYVPKLF